jgi:hypothetical protein
MADLESDPWASRIDGGTPDDGDPAEVFDGQIAVKDPLSDNFCR